MISQIGNLVCKPVGKELYYRYTSQLGEGSDGLERLYLA